MADLSAQSKDRITAQTQMCLKRIKFAYRVDNASDGGDALISKLWWL